MIKPQEAERIVLKGGWYQIKSNGGHRQYKHPTKPGKVTIPFHPGDLKLYEIKSIEKQSGLKLR